VIRAVVDTSVLVSAFVGDPDAGPGQLVDAWREQRFVLVVSPHLLDELSDVLTRPKLERWAAEGRAQAYVDGFAARSEEHADPDQSSPSGLRDPDDDYLVALMRSSGADMLVSVDRDLLDAQLADVTVLDPAKFLDRLTREQP
jgi:putative PIN family toxin of toxin-antitoxin system